MFMDKETQYCQNISSSQYNLYIKCNPNQNRSNLLSDSKIFGRGETARTRRRRPLEDWQHSAARLTVNLQEPRDCGVAERKGDGPMDGKRRESPEWTQSTDLWPRRKGNTREERQPFQQKLLEPWWPTRGGDGPDILHKQYLQVGHRRKLKTCNYSDDPGERPEALGDPNTS